MIKPSGVVAEEAGKEKAVEAEQVEIRKFNLLLAEDKPMNQKLAKVLLEKMGHRVEIVSNGREAVAALKASSYDAVLMDISMPEMDGLGATRQIRAWEEETGRYRTPLVAMTAYAMKGDREEFLKAGLDDYISKPIRNDALANVLQRVELKITRLEPEPGQADLEVLQKSASPVLPDISAMLERVDGNTELLEELVGHFLEDYHREVAALEKAGSEDDFNKAGKIMYGFKGELGDLYINEAYLLAKDLDEMLKNEDLACFAQALERFKNSVAKYERYFSQEQWKNQLE